MLKIWVIFACLAIVQAAPVDPTHPTLKDYCDIKEYNTPCLYKCKRDNAKCGDYPYKYQHLDHKEKKFALDIHNGLRNAMAGGAYKSSGFPAAADMMVLSWDRECEWMTGCYALQCTWAHDRLKQPIGELYPQGQNLMRTKNEQDVDHLDYEFYNLSMQEWFVEYKDVTPAINKILFTSMEAISDPLIGHFTQFVWSTTRLVGCAKYKFKGEGYFQRFFFCNYFPAGNRLGKVMYIRGKPASQCPNGTKPNSKYKNLCGEIRSMKKDKFVPPVDLDPEGTRRENEVLMNEDDDDAAWMPSGLRFIVVAALLLALLLQ